MPSFKSKNAYEIMYYMLSNAEFTQRQMARDLGIPHGYKISSFVNWLEKIGFVSKTYNSITKSKAYEVRSPAALIDFFSRHRRMADLKIDSFEIGSNHEEVISYLTKNNVIFCLTTALSYYDQYFRDPLVHAYVPNLKFIEDISKKPRGIIKVILYQYDLPDKFQIKDNRKITSSIRTIIDLYCDDKAYTTEQLIRKIWGHEQGIL